jgi:hypothetical protein
LRKHKNINVCMLYASINRTVLEDANNTKSHGNQRLHGCMCSGGRLLMMDTIMSETCRAT